ncbi:uncharacterized protein C8Q71DRAFT_436612 [Rhodofomes roseus]|uniref:Polyketide synthase-like phosphopantetheine-binding domain-containing protein n=1 Tax=Rhodofomes roseus TaxID=34475 RepID=A0ABQ8KQZ6_9APHY|nr:uncharacterized protein C8Q71DRAFT_436612 [Rhodofomes roseus]KAH9841056.1 hypothetical protein C8Q71DRAFT_436612 [Rhodofomes roseus]
MVNGVLGCVIHAQSSTRPCSWKPSLSTMVSRRFLPPPPQTQARSSTTFRPPPLDGSLSLPEIFDWHAVHTQDHRLFVFAKGDGTLRTIYWPEAVRAVYTGATILRTRLADAAVGGETPIVAILAPSDAIPYFTMMMSIMRANYVAFPISPRNSPLAVAHLINKVGVSHVLVGREQAMQDLVNEALAILTTRYDAHTLPTLSPMPLFEELFLPETAEKAEPPSYVYKGPDALAMVLHSSGSTAFPKPILWTNHRFCQLCLIPWFGERDLTGQVFSLHTMPMFHGMGVLQLCWTASSGLVVSSFEPKSPAPVPTPDALFVAAKATESDIVFCVPSFIEAWSRNPDYVRWLASRGGVLFGGGPLNKEAGDFMTSQGVSIFILYGSTEGGIMSPILPSQVGYDWDYFKFPGLVTPHMEPYGDNTYEFVMLENEYCRPSVINTKIGGVDAYASSDMMIPHPTKQGYWKVFGRTDDQIMHNTGEKTNPGPLENMLNQDPHVLASVMFGRGRFQAGILVDPRPQHRFDPADETKLAEFRNMIWPTVERMNAYAPQHSRLFKEMIIVSNPSKPFTYTAKSTARRQAVIDDYAEEIDAAYDRVEESTQSSIPPPSQWDHPTTLEFVRAVINKVLVHNVDDNDNIFQHGCDSLQATHIRNALLRALRDSAQLDTRKSVGNFVYDLHTVTSLAAFLLELATGAWSGSMKSIEGRADSMLAMAAKYLNDLPEHKSATSTASLHPVILVTGTTGSLGSFLLSRLVEDPSVARIYAVNRPARDGRGLRARQEAAMASRGLDIACLENSKVVLLEADISVAGFNLSHEVYAEMQSSVTHVIHNAWRVDFNLSLESFEPNVKGVRHLIDFALSSPRPSPPRTLFTSSIGVFQNIEGVQLAEQFISPAVAVGSGYSESKWVAERILMEAAEKTSLETLVVRVGQICGAPDGAWNAHEWFPSMVQSAPILGCFPDDPKAVSWVPLATAASALAGLVHAAYKKDVIHLIHPRPVTWSSLAAVIADELDVSLVPFAEWLSRLEALHDAPPRRPDARTEVELLRTVRALRVLPWYQGLQTSRSGTEALGFPALSVARAKELSPVLAEAASLSSEDVRKWLAFWRETQSL